jgi:hypothetical protein
MSQNAAFSVGNVTVVTTENRGFSPEYYAERLVDRLILVSKDAPPEIRHQALAYQEMMRQSCLATINMAIRSNHTTLIALLRKNGMEDAANLIWKLGT